MKTRKTTKAIILAIAATTGISTSEANNAARMARADMQNALGAEHVFDVCYNWDPFDGMLA